ncbi:violaxanthin de-epoxidase [Chrysochromulina tobinii]|uniref:Violaxanthin de-epoxidase n=1 Tax=Chrysochromulina tobinii TaxID=1460289 RepID=A0A0M0J306_9EUKA|nr:violaxanthin de-epoxidase [Chrysochromulina tobinii]|eukprot:KOO20926.1 violaxanthin de-epoxidase [Chrysochromulina sp. CCMP291]
MRAQVQQPVAASSSRSAAAAATAAAVTAAPRWAAAVLVSAALSLQPPLPAIAETTTAGFEEFAAAGGKMKADPNCFFTDCKEPTKACFTNPACLKGITCLGNCRGEQLCATQCFARFGSEKLNSWLSCTLEEKECVSTGVKQDTSKFYANAPPVAPAFKPSDLEGKWYKVLGYSPKYDMYPCQTNTFTARADGGLENDILFRVPKPDGSGSWTNNFKETMDNSKGPRGTASMVVEGKMFGLTFHEDWYVIGVGKGYRVVAYKGDTQQGPYEGAFVFTETKDALQGSASDAMRLAIDADIRRGGLDPSQMAPIDNSCPDDTIAAGVSSTEASKEKLEWKDVFELTEWFRPGTLKKDTSFDPNKM